MSALMWKSAATGRPKGGAACAAKASTETENGEPVTGTEPVSPPPNGACDGGSTWNAPLCDCVCTVPAAQELAPGAQTTAGSSAADPASLGICHACPLCETSTTRYAPGCSATRCGGAPGVEASSSAGRTTMESWFVSTGGPLGPGRGCSAGRNGVGSTAAGTTCVSVVCRSG